MSISEDRVSHLAHKILDAVRQSGAAEFPDISRSLQSIKDSIAGYFAVTDEIDEAVRKKLASYSQTKVPGSREWDILYQKFFKEELDKRKW